MCKEAEFVEKAEKIIFDACRNSMAKVKEGDTIVIDEKFKFDYGTNHKWRAGDEFLVHLVKRNQYGTVIYGVATKAPSDGGMGVRGSVGDHIDFGTEMPLFEYLRVKGDMTAKNNMRKLCRDYLEGLL